MPGLQEPVGAGPQVFTPEPGVAAGARAPEPRSGSRPAASNQGGERRASSPKDGSIEIAPASTTDAPITELPDSARATAPEPTELPRPGVRSAEGLFATRLSLIGAAILLVGLGLSNGAGTKGIAWFVFEPLLAVAGAAVISALASKGQEPWWGGGVLVGLGSYLVVTLLPLINTPDYGFQTGEVVMAIGAGLIAGGGLSLWRRSPSSDPRSVGLMSAAGALIIMVSAFLPLTGDDGPKLLTEMGIWVVGSEAALIVPLLLVVGWIFLLSVYPSRRPTAQRGQVLGFGLELAAFFLAMTAASVTEFWGTGIGLWLALAGAGLVLVGAARPAPASAA